MGQTPVLSFSLSTCPGQSVIMYMCKCTISEAVAGVARDSTPSKYCIRGVVFSRPLAK